MYAIRSYYDARVAQKPFPDDDLLLVSPGEVPHVLLERGRLDLEARDHFVRKRGGLAPVQHAAGRDHVQVRHGEVIEHRELHAEAVVLAVLGNGEESGLNRVRGRFNRDCLPVEENLPRVFRRITSYNVCYTKLLRGPVHARSMFTQPAQA